MNGKIILLVNRETSTAQQEAEEDEIEEFEPIEKLQKLGINAGMSHDIPNDAQHKYHWHCLGLQCLPAMSLPAGIKAITKSWPYHLGLCRV